MNQELGLKLTDALYEYHENFINPRLARLELPWWRRIFTKKPDPYKKEVTPPTTEEMYKKLGELEEEAANGGNQDPASA